MLILILMMISLIGVVLLGDYNQVKDAKKEIFERNDIDENTKERLWKIRRAEL